MSKEKKHSKILKVFLTAALILLLLELVLVLWFEKKDDDAPAEDASSVSTTETQAETGEAAETDETAETETEARSILPWEEAGAKQPADYTWEEYEALTGDQQKAFCEALGDAGFEAWLNTMREQAQINPWDEPGAKRPEDYTLEEFEALTGAQQIAFQNYLGLEEFGAWLDRVQEQPGEKNPWEEPGAKQPADYTLAEFEALTADQQIAFQDYLGREAFAAWLDGVQEQLVEKNPWEEAGAKRPEDYTLAEYEALTGAQQTAFQDYLGLEAFEAWLERVQEQPAGQNPWEKPGAKRPEDYTLAEFEALTGAQQIAFQNYLGADAFEDWLNRVQNQTAANPWEVPGAKKPEDYTWEEFEALTGAQQMAFQNYLGAAGFEAWLNRVQNQTAANPWEVPGAKQPEDYTWAEFEALTGAQQIAFQNYLGEAAFEEWLNRVLAEENP